MFGNKTVTIYPDVYDLNTTRKQLEEGLRQRGWWDRVFWPALDRIAAQPSGKAECLPLTMDISFNGEPLDVQGALVGGRSYVPFGAHSLDGSKNLDVKDWAGTTYLDVETYADLLGLSVEVEGTSIHLRSPRAYLGDRLLGGVLTIDRVLHPRQIPKGCSGSTHHSPRASAAYWCVSRGLLRSGPGSPPV